MHSCMNQRLPCDEVKTIDKKQFALTWANCAVLTCSYLSINPMTKYSLPELLNKNYSSFVLFQALIILVWL